MGARDALRLVQSAHTDEQTRLQGRARRKVNKIVRRVSKQLRNDAEALWLAQFGKIDIKIDEEDALMFAISLKILLQTRVENVVSDLAEVEDQIIKQAEQMGRRQARERLAALHG